MIGKRTIRTLLITIVLLLVICNIMGTYLHLAMDQCQILGSEGCNSGTDETVILEKDHDYRVLVGLWDDDGDEVRATVTLYLDGSEYVSVPLSAEFAIIGETIYTPYDEVIIYVTPGGDQELRILLEDVKGDWVISVHEDLPKLIERDLCNLYVAIVIITIIVLMLSGSLLFWIVATKIFDKLFGTGRRGERRGYSGKYYTREETFVPFFDIEPGGE